MNAHISKIIGDLLQDAQETGQWERLARELAGEFVTKPKRATRTKAADGPDETLYLTNPEREARGLPRLKEGKFAGDAYLWAVVEFADGTRVLAGCYPRAKDPADLSPAVRSARYRRLMLASGGIYVDAAAIIPAVVSVTRLTDPEEIDTARASWARQRAALQTFTLAPYWDGDMPRPINWIRAKAQTDGRVMPDGRMIYPAELATVIRKWCDAPSWWQGEYAPESDGYAYTGTAATEEPKPAEKKSVGLRLVRTLKNGTALSVAA